MSKLTFSQQVDIKIKSRINFLLGQAELHKIAFAETGDKSHLEAMKEFQHGANLIDFLQKNSHAISKENRRLKETLDKK